MCYYSMYTMGWPNIAAAMISIKKLNNALKCENDKLPKWYKDKKLVEWEKSMMTMKNDHGGISNRRGREELTSTVCWHL